MIETTLNRHNAAIDPHLTIWGWEIPVYLFLGGLTAGVMILSALMGMRRTGKERSRWARWLPFMAPVLLSLGMGALFLDLSHKLYVWRFYLALKLSSPMSWGSWLLLLIYPAALALGIAELTRAEAERLFIWGPISLLEEPLTRLRGWLKKRLALLRWTNVVLGVALAGYTGVLLSTLGARAVWSSSILAPLFLVSGLSTGAAFMMLFPINREEHDTLRRWDLVAIAVEVALLGLLFVGLSTGGGAAGKSAAALVLTGRYASLFWPLVILAGLAVPFVIEAFEGRSGRKATLLAPLLLLVGGLSLRWVLVLAGQWM